MINIKNNKGFALIELAVTIAIFGILTLITLTAYRKFVKESMISEGKILVSSIAKTQKLYHAEAGDYHPISNASYTEIPEIDSRHNKYFKNFSVRAPGDFPDSVFTVITTSDLSFLCCVEVILHAFKDKPNMLIVNVGKTSTTTIESDNNNGNGQEKNGNNGNGNGNNGNGNGNGNTADGDDNNKGNGQEKHNNL